MSSCIKDLYEYDLIKKCSNCGKVKLKTIFHKNTKCKAGLQSQCIFCVNDYMTNYSNKSRDSELERCKKNKKFKIVER